MVRIYWKNYSQSTYSHGSQIDFQKDQVFFENSLMPPSFVIKSWDSMTNFQAVRSQPSLPLLKKGASYQLDLVAEVEPKHAAYLQINFFDRHHEKIHFEILKNQQNQFTYPQEAYSYQIALINAGATSLTFKYLSLRALGSEDSVPQGMLLYPQTGTSVTLLLLEEEEDATLYADVIEQIGRKVGNLLILEARDAMSEQGIVDLQGWAKKHGYSHMTIIGYGSRGNQAGLHLHLKLKESKFYLSQSVNRIRLDKALLAQLNIDQARLEQVMREEKGLMFYMKQQVGMQLVSGLIHPLPTLLHAFSNAKT